MDAMDGDLRADGEQGVATGAPRGRDLVSDGNGGMRPRANEREATSTAFRMVSGGKEVGLPDASPHALVPGRRPSRDLVPDGNGGMRPADDGPSREVILAGAVPGTRDLTFGGASTVPTGMLPTRLLGLDGFDGFDGPWDPEMKPEIPPPLKEKYWPPPEVVDHVRTVRAFWIQRVVDQVQLEGGWAVKKGWSHRDGATLCALDGGRLLLIGGWDTSDDRQTEWEPEDFADPAEKKRGWTFTTNEVWKSDNEGATWEILLHHKVIGLDPGERFKRVHTPAWTRCNDGYFYLIGGDVFFPHSEVWRTSLSGNGEFWEYMGDVGTLNAAWGKRILSIAGSLTRPGGLAGPTTHVLYVMGGQLDTNPNSAQNDVYQSVDQGRSWYPVPWHPEVPWGPLLPRWEPRGMVSGMPVIRDPVTGIEELYLVGGGRYGLNGPDTFFDSVWKFDGFRWKMVRPTSTPGDPNGWVTGYNNPPGQPKTCGRKYHTVVLTPPGPDLPYGLIWVIVGAVMGGNCKKIVISKDRGKTWEEAPLEADWGGATGSHADGAIAYKGGILRASGNAFDRSTYRILRVTFREYHNRRRPVVSSVAPPPLQTGAGKGQTVVLTGIGFETVRAVYVDPSTVNVTYAKFTPPTTDTRLEVEIPEIKLRDENGLGPYFFPIVVVNVDGSSAHTEGIFQYLP
jgi:hypothetical protein